ALRRWTMVQASSEFPDESWPDEERTQIQEALALLDANHATASVLERTSTARAAWEGRAT
ncbi:MAG: hypothetical protein OER77_16430, partial [Myxococcales bacterium]|nr:hypothetical protein [Myxococcales bacterium]